MNIELSTELQHRLDHYLASTNSDAQAVVQQALEAYLLYQEFEDKAVDGDISPAEMEMIQSIVGSRLKSVQDGTATLLTIDQVFDEIAAEVLS